MASAVHCKLGFVHICFCAFTQNRFLTDTMSDAYHAVEGDQEEKELYAALCVESDLVPEQTKSLLSFSSSKSRALHTSSEGCVVSLE